MQGRIIDLALLVVFLRIIIVIYKSAVAMGVMLRSSAVVGTFSMRCAIQACMRDKVSDGLFCLPQQKKA